LAELEDRTILVVEDEEPVRRMTLRVLRHCGFQNILEACSSEEALELMGQHPAAVDLLLTDLMMPGIGGVELVEKLRETWPELRVVFMSGYTDDELKNRAVEISNADFLQKPFSPQQLDTKVRRLLLRDRNG
jgi:CheY-like chemotaxis protein